MARTSLVRWLAASVASLAIGCGATQGTTSTAANGAPAPGERIWRSKCGACHVPVQPGTRERAYLETAFKRHRTRVHLSEPEWSSVVDFLAKPPANVASTSK